MLELLNRLGKTGAVVGENGLLIALLAIFGKNLPPETLIGIHTALMFLKSIYLHYQTPPTRVGSAQKAETLLQPILGDLSMLTERDKAAHAAVRIYEELAAKKAILPAARIADVIIEEMSKTDDDYYNQALGKLSPIEKKVLEERLAPKTVEVPPAA